LIHIPAISTKRYRYNWTRETIQRTLQ